MQSACHLLRRLASQQRGNVAMIFTLAFIPLMSVIGIAIDFRLVELQRTKVLAALDSALLFAARERQSGLSQEAAQTSARSNFSATIAANGVGAVCDPVNISFSQISNEITGSVRCRHDTMIVGIIGHPVVDFDIDTAVDYGIGKLDVVFVFDSSGSMAGTKLANLKSAAATAVDTILPPALVADGDVRIAMVTYNDMVNAGALFDAVTDEAVYTDTYGSYFWTRYPTSDMYCDSSTWYNGARWYRCWNTHLVEVDHTCVFERGGDEAFTAALPGEDAWLQFGLEDDDSCPTTKPLPLTNDRNKLHQYILNLTAAGGTAGHQGIAWGWYMIAPEWESLYPTAAKPLPYDEPDSTKVIIMMTDGAFNSEYFWSQGSSTSQARDLCDAIKESTPVLIYTVAFQAPTAGQEVLDYCKSEEGMYFAATNSEQLQDAYRQIATSISDLRLSL